MPTCGGQIRGPGRGELRRPARTDLWSAGAQRGRQNHGAADPEHRAAAFRRPGRGLRIRRRNPIVARAAHDRFHVGQYGRLRADDGLGDGRILRPAVRHRRRAAASPDGRPVHAAADERHPRRARRQDVDRHEAEGVDRRGDRPRSAGADLRRSDQRSGRAGCPVLLQTVSELRDNGKCVVFSTYIMREAEKLCDRIAIMHRGRILAEGTLEECATAMRSATWRSCFFS